MPWFLRRHVRQHVAVACCATNTGCPRYGVCRPSLSGCAVAAGDHDGVAIEIAQPQLAMRRASGAFWRIPNRTQQDLGSKRRRARNRAIEVFELTEPKQRAVATHGVGIAHVSVVMVDVP